VVVVNLDEQQRRAVDAAAGPVAILAGPGSGKTTTLVGRIARLCAAGEIDPASTLALCHTTKAAGELSARLARTAATTVNTSTIHAAAWRCVRGSHEAAGFGPTPQLCTNVYPLVRAAAREVLGAAAADVVPDVVAEIDWASARLLDPTGYVAARRSRDAAVDATHVADIWGRYRAAKSAEGLVDFADTLRIAARILTDSPLAGGLASAVDAVFVDEYQDVDAAQQQLIEAWLGDSDRLCVVGDPNQAIYGFKGADPSLLTGFADRWPTATVVSLTANYRSTPQVVDWVNRLAATGTAPLSAADTTAGPAPVVVAASDETSEERALCDQLRRWHRDGVAWNEMAVLYRFRASAARLEAALVAAGVPHHVAGSERFFERPEVRAVLVPFGQAARSTPDADGLALLADAAERTGWDPQNPPPGAGPARQRWEAVTALVTAAAEQHDGLSARWLLSELQQRAKAAHDLTPGGVTLATVHAAKGLEWDAVWVAGAVEGQMPSAFAKSAAELTEERNICFVAMSRARRHLVVSHAARRHNGWTSKPSRYLDRLTTPNAAGRGRTKGTASTSSGAASAPARGGCERCGERLRSAEARQARRCSRGCADGEVAARYDQLERWRQDVAASEGVAAAKVAADRALFRAAVRGSTAQVTGLTLTGRPQPPF
jgi:DNA helicase-2/ATP-dependent DNA helicase PcrA